MTSKHHLLTILLPFVSFAAVAQTIQYKDVVSTHVELAKDTVLLGEPFFLYFVINNHSKDWLF